MAGFIVLDDGRAWNARNWAYDRAIDLIASALPRTVEGDTLARWLRTQLNSVAGPGLGYVDVRELTPNNRMLFVNAVRMAVASAAVPGPGEPTDNGPGQYREWLDRFAALLHMIESVERGDPPSALNPFMTDILSPTGKRSGPGWDGPTAA